MKEVGAIMRIGESRVSQIHSAALLRLKVRFPELMAKPPRHKSGLAIAVAASRQKSSARMELSKAS
jgi:hypothetical protein